MSDRLIPALRLRMVVLDDDHAFVDASDRIPGLTLKADRIATGDWRGIAKSAGPAFVTSGYTDPASAMGAAFVGLTMVGA